MEHIEGLTFGELLKDFRKRRGLNQKGLASKVGKHPITVSDWERSLYLPGLRDTVLTLAYVLHLSHAETDALLRAAQYPEEYGTAIQTQERQTVHAPSAVPSVDAPLWAVPYQRNPYFTGRQAMLEQLHHALAHEHTVALSHPQTISGLGGIGKTQVALEYVYRYYSAYSAVLWMRAESHDTLLADFSSLAHLLALPEATAREQEQLVKAVLAWFHSHTGWLLILDNADDFPALSAFLPALGHGHILITTRAHSLGDLAPHPLLLDVLEPEEGKVLILRRAGLLSIGESASVIPEHEWRLAGELVEAMGALPLALEQAGAYMEETGCSLSQYLERYHAHHTDILKRRSLYATYPETVATTWSLSFARVEKENPDAAALLRYCAFLSPDAISEEMFREGGKELGPLLSQFACDPLRFDAACETLLRYSLIKRNSETRTLSVHRLVQTVLRDTMSGEEHRQWVERALRLLHRAFPKVELAAVDTAVWPQCEHYLPHVQIQLPRIEQDRLSFLEAAQLLQYAGSYLYLRGRYTEAAPLLEEAVVLFEQVLGEEHTEVAKTLNILGRLYRRQGNYDDAERCYLRALSLLEQVFGPEHSQVAGILNNLGLLYENQGKYAEAEPLFLRALAIREHLLGPEDPLVANVLNNLGLLYDDQGRFTEAQPLLERALRITEKTLGPTHLDTATTLNDVGALYRKLGKYSEAEDCYQRAMAIWQQSYGTEHPNVAATLLNRATLALFQQHYAEAEALFKQALTIYEKALGAEHPDLAKVLLGLGDVRTKHEHYAEAEAYYQQALVLRENAYGAESEGVAECLASLAALYALQGKGTEAEHLFQRAIAIQEHILGMEHPDTRQTKEKYLALVQEHR